MVVEVIYEEKHETFPMSAFILSIKKINVLCIIVLTADVDTMRTFNYCFVKHILSLANL